MIRVSFFGRAADRLGREREIELPHGVCTVGELRHILVKDAGVAGQILLGRDIRACVDDQIVSDLATVASGQKVAFFSLMSGG